MGNKPSKTNDKSHKNDYNDYNYVDNSINNSKNGRYALAVCGYIRELRIMLVPNDIKLTIILFCSSMKCTIYGIGTNSGQFGLGNITELKNWKKLKEFSQLVCHHDNIYHSSCFIKIKTSFNEIYVAGSNNFSQCGVSINDPVTEFQKVTLNNNNSGIPAVIAYGSCANVSIIMDSNNRFYKFGSDHYGDNKQYSKPFYMDKVTKQFQNISINKICVGCSHGLYLTKNGNVYSFGSNKYGQIGFSIDNYKDLLQPKLLQIDPDNKIKHIECGGYHSMLLSLDNQIYVFGSNSNGELGIGVPKYKPPVPRRRKVNADAFNKHILTEKEQQKKDKKENKIVDKVTLNTFFQKVQGNDIIINAGLYHNMYINMKNGKCYTFGSNYHGAVGKPNQEGIVSTPYLHQNKFIVNGDAGPSHTLYIDKNNQLYVTGAVGNDTNRIHEITQIQKKKIGIKKKQHVVRVIAGRSFDLIVVSDDWW